MIKKYIFLLIIIFYYPILAKEGLEIPRFAIIKSNKVHARTGPGSTYPIEWVYIKKNEPIEIIAVFEQWRKIRDYEGDGGWVHVSMLSPKKSVIIKDDCSLFKRPNSNSYIIANLSKDLRCKLVKCKDQWCKLECMKCQGWVEQSKLWGWGYDIK